MNSLIPALGLAAGLAIGALMPTTALATDSTQKQQQDTKDQAKKKPAWDAMPVDKCPVGREKPSVHCSTTVAGQFDPQGRLWLAWTNDGRVHVNNTADLGKTFSAPVPVNAEAQSVDNNGENRPKLAIGPKGEIYVTYTIHAKAPYTGDVYFSRSLDGGKTFSPARSLNDQPDVKSSLRFEAVDVAADGRVFVAWLDKRDLFAAKKAKTPYPGSAIYYAMSTDQGASFTPNRLIAHHTCECCRVVMDMEQKARPIVVWRHIFDGMRDHGVVRFTDDGVPEPMTRLSTDNWPIEGCPHHGPSISIAASGRAHVAWFTDGELRQGPFHAWSDDGGRSFGNITPIGAEDTQAEHPYVLAAGGKVHLAWKDLHENQSRFQVKTSTDGGQSWSAPRTLFSTGGGSDHPQLVAHDGQTFALWRTEADGMRLAPVKED